MDSFCASLYVSLTFSTRFNASASAAFSDTVLHSDFRAILIVFSACGECAIKMHLPVTYSLSLEFFMMLWLYLEPEIRLLHPSASAIEKIRIMFINEPLTDFGLISTILFSHSFIFQYPFLSDPTRSIISSSTSSFIFFEWLSLISLLFQPSLLVLYPNSSGVFPLFLLC